MQYSDNFYGYKDKQVGYDPKKANVFFTWNWAIWIDALFLFHYSHLLSISCLYFYVPKAIHSTKPFSTHTNDKAFSEAN